MEPARRDFAAATQAFHRADYSQALSLFKRARDAGMDTPTLHYNLGVTYYRLQRYDESENEFRILVADRATVAVAKYNLGLIAMQRGHNDAARGYFQQVLDTDAPAQLHALAAAALARFNEKRVDARVQGVISLSGGYDDNVALTPEADLSGVSNRSDGFTEMIAAARIRLSGTADNGLRLDAGGLLRSYLDQSDYSLQAGRVGLARLTPLGYWAGLVGANVDTIYLDGDNFQNLATLTLQATRPLAQARSLQLRYRASRIDGGENYEYLQGWRQRLSAELAFPGRHQQWLLGYELELNNRRDLQQGAETFSQSPRHHALYTEVRMPVKTRMNVIARTEYRRSNYSGEDVQTDGSETQHATRDDNQWQASVQANYRIDSRWRAFAIYTHIDNNANFDSFNYRRNSVQAGVELNF